jgi:hypothetical protein
MKAVRERREIMRRRDLLLGAVLLVFISAVWAFLWVPPCVGP